MAYISCLYFVKVIGNTIRAFSAIAKSSLTFVFARVLFVSMFPLCVMSDTKKFRAILIVLAALCVLFLAFVGVLTFRSPGGPQKATAVETTTQAIEIIRALPEVVAYEKALTKAGTAAHVDAQSEGAQWIVQVYEVKDGHTATFNWYTVDKATGGITTEFP